MRSHGSEVDTGDDALVHLVARYDLRWTDDPSKPYPVEGPGSCPPGWIPLLAELVAKLVALGWDRRLALVKETFGTLRSYVGNRTPAMAELIEEAERRSASQCERCGALGALRGGARLNTLCDEHAAGRRPLDVGHFDVDRCKS